VDSLKRKYELAFSAPSSPRAADDVIDLT